MMLSVYGSWNMNWWREMAMGFLHGIVKRGVRIFGSRIRDEESGREVGRAFVVVWNGRIYLLGFSGDTPVIPVFLPENRVRYWRRRIGFRIAPQPDYPKVERTKGREEDFEV